MAQIFAIVDVMPESVEINLNDLIEKVKGKIQSFGADFGEVKEEELAFGLKKLKFVVVSEEEKGSLDELAESISSLEEVKSAEVVDVRRAIG